MTTNPLISIITPCYNSEKWLGRYLDSIINQEYKKIELIIINDGSTDATNIVIDNYKEKLEKNGISLVYKYKENGGLGSAINLGLKLITGKYFCWCDSDNFYDPRYLSEKVEVLKENSKISVLRCDGYIVNDGDVLKPIRLMSKGNKEKHKANLFLNALLVKNFHFGCAMLKTESFDKVVKDRDIYESREGQNWQIMLPMLYNFKAYYIDKPLFYFVNRSDSISNIAIVQADPEKIIHQQEEYFKIIENTLISMNILEYEKFITMVKRKYWGNILSIAFNHKIDDYFFSYYKNIKENNIITLKTRFQKFVYNKKVLRIILNSIKKIKLKLISEKND